MKPTRFVNFFTIVILMPAAGAVFHHTPSIPTFTRALEIPHVVRRDDYGEQNEIHVPIPNLVYRIFYFERKKVAECFIYTYIFFFCKEI